jgi:hypothetical protein
MSDNKIKPLNPRSLETPDNRAPRAVSPIAHDILDSLDSQIAVLDTEGIIVFVNKSWIDFANENNRFPSEFINQTDVGVNYLQVLAESNGENSHEAAPALVGIKKVISGELNFFSLEYPCHSPTEPRWFVMVVNPLNASHKGVVIRHQNITARKLLEAERLENLNLIERLHREEKLRNKFVGMVPGGFCTYKKGVDGNLSIPFASNGWEDLFEVRASDVVNDATPALQRIHPDDVEFVSSSFGKAM